MAIEYTYLEEIQEDNKQTHLLNKWKQIQSKQRHSQGHHGEFEPGKAQYSTPKFSDRLFLIKAYWNPKSRQGPNRGGPELSCGVFSLRIQILDIFCIIIEAILKQLISAQYSPVVESNFRENT